MFSLIEWLRLEIIFQVDQKLSNARFGIAMKIFARAHKNTVRFLGRLFVYPGKISIRESNVNSLGIVKSVFPLTTSSTVSKYAYILTYVFHLCCAFHSRGNSRYFSYDNSLNELYVCFLWIQCKPKADRGKLTIRSCK